MLAADDETEILTMLRYVTLECVRLNLTRQLQLNPGINTQFTLGLGENEIYVCGWLVSGVHIGRVSATVLFCS